mmetsp:Transcript_25517/g.35812  ORF Transcript_25517/g.35812 Transcript_25517/m.35812 type:complete len:251 (+) Transcript_25517:573-1325(+)
MLHYSTGCLSVHQVTIHQSIFKEGCHSVDIVLAHFTNVFKHEGERFQNTILNVHFWYSVFVHQGRQHSEWHTSLSHNSNSNRGTDSVLTLLHSEVVQQGSQHILRSNSLCNVTKGVDSSSSNSLLVGFKHFKELKADTHPFSSRDKFGTSVCNTTNKVDTVLLDFLVSVLQDRCESRQEILDRRGHLGHTNDIDNSLQSTQDGAKHFRILFTKVFIKNNTQVTHQLLFVALLHDHSGTRDQVSSLLSDLS